MDGSHPSAVAPRDEPRRGRHAEKPSEVPPAGWLDILSRTRQQLAEDNLTVVAAGVAFYGFVAVVPALAALIGLYALIADPAQITRHVEALAQVAPHEVMPLLREQMNRITTDNQAAGVSAVTGLLVACYSSASAMKALITGLNIAYDERERRSFLRLNAVALLLTLCGIAGALLAIGLVAVAPAALGHLGLSGGVETAVGWLRWPVLALGFVLALAVVYRFGPSREEAQWRWVSWGAVAGAALWLLGSTLFSLYVSRFGSYDRTYGSLGAIVVFLLWLFISALAVLLGAELNSEMERQTKKDTTDGPPAPLGRRGAHAADTVGPSRP